MPKILLVDDEKYIYSEIEEDEIEDEDV